VKEKASEEINAIDTVVENERLDVRWKCWRMVYQK